jgi:acyl-CoA thioesterase
MASTPVRVSSMTWMIDIVVDDLASEDGWYLFRSHAETVRGGFSTQDMSIWNRKGQLVAKGRQTVTMFG